MRIFSVILPVRISGLLFSELSLSIACYLLACVVYFRGGTGDYLFEYRGWLRIALVALSITLGLFVNNLYASTRVESGVALVFKLCNVVGIALIVQGLLSYITSGVSLPRLVMIGGSLLVFTALLAWRLFYARVFLRIIGMQSVIFAGCDSVTQEIAERIQRHPELGFWVAGYVASSGSSDSIQGEYLGPIEELERAAAKLKPGRIVVGMLDQRQNWPSAALLKLARQGIVIEDAASAYEATCGRVCSRELRPSQIIFHNELASRPGSVALQSIYTNLLALLGIAITSPILLACALAIKLTSRGPAFETNLRVGLHGIPFSLHRFRCHRLPDAKAPFEPRRLTPVGKLLRRLHLVNLPCLFNLLRGEISLVGPRPERPEFVQVLSTYFAYYHQRHSVKPGLTGWSQINTPTPERRVNSLLQLEYDLYYTKHISLALDAYIILHGLRASLPFAHK